MTPPRFVATESATEMADLEIVDGDALSDDLDDATLYELNERFERLPASAIVEWAVERFHPSLCLAASMTDAVLIDIATKIEPSLEIVFIDTGYHFPETLQTVEVVRKRYEANIKVMKIPPASPPLWQQNPEACCSAAKVAQLERALEDKAAWMSGLRRTEAITRVDAPIVSRDKRGLVKINPIATWDDLDVEGYIADHDVPVNPLLLRGYPSIGCWPCTKPVSDGDDIRAGRWAGSDKTECGLHL